MLWMLDFPDDTEGRIRVLRERATWESKNFYPVANHIDDAGLKNIAEKIGCERRRFDGRYEIIGEIRKKMRQDAYGPSGRDENLPPLEPYSWRAVGAMRADREKGYSWTEIGEAIEGSADAAGRASKSVLQNLSENCYPVADIALGLWDPRSPESKFMESHDGALQDHLEGIGDKIGIHALCFLAEIDVDAVSRLERSGIATVGAALNSDDEFLSRHGLGVDDIEALRYVEYLEGMAGKASRFYDPVDSRYAGTYRYPVSLEARRDPDLMIPFLENRLRRNTPAFDDIMRQLTNKEMVVIATKLGCKRRSFPRVRDGADEIWGALNDRIESEDRARSRLAPLEPIGDRDFESVIKARMEGRGWGEIADAAGMRNSDVTLMRWTFNHLMRSEKPIVRIANRMWPAQSARIASAKAHDKALRDLRSGKGRETGVHALCFLAGTDDRAVQILARAGADTIGKAMALNDEKLLRAAGSEKGLESVRRLIADPRIGKEQGNKNVDRGRSWRNHGVEIS